MYESQASQECYCRELFGLRHRHKTHSHKENHSIPGSLLPVLLGSKPCGFAAIVLLAACVVAATGCGGLTYSNSGSTGSGVALNDISCGTASLSGAQTKACSVTLNATALSSTAVQLSSSNSALQVPPSVTIAVGQNSASFNAISAKVTQSVSVTITGTLRGVAKTSVMTLYPATATLAGVSCKSQTLAGPSTTICNVNLSSAATSPTLITLSSSNSALQVPASVTVNTGATTAGFAAIASAVSTVQNITLTASSAGVSQSYAVQLVASNGTVVQHKVQLSWNPPGSSSTAIVGYNIYRAITGYTSYALLSPTLDAQSTFTDTSVSSGLTYDYIVTSVDSGGTESAPSNSTEVTIP